MLRIGSVFSRSVVPRPTMYKQVVANIVYGEEGVCWKYDPDFEPKEPCLRAGLKGNPYGTRASPFTNQVTGRLLYRLPLKHPLWKDVYKALDDSGVGRDWLDLTIPAVLPDFPMEAKKRNPHYVPGKYPTLRNAYYEQQKIHLQQEREKSIKEVFYRKRRLANRWEAEKKKNSRLREILAEISPEMNEDIDNSISNQTKVIEGSSTQ